MDLSTSGHQNTPRDLMCFAPLRRQFLHSVFTTDLRIRRFPEPTFRTSPIQSTKLLKSAVSCNSYCISHARKPLLTSLLLWHLCWWTTCCSFPEGRRLPSKIPWIFHIHKTVFYRLVNHHECILGRRPSCRGWVASRAVGSGSRASASQWGQAECHMGPDIFTRFMMFMLVIVLIMANTGE